MDLEWGLLLLTGIVPLVEAMRANHRTTLRQPLLWALSAWMAWTVVSWRSVLGAEDAGRLGPYLALCLTGCAGIAVLGARRPGVAAWNFVVVGLLAVLLLPVVQGWGKPRLETAHALFLGAALLVPFLNYLPTRLGFAALLLSAGCGTELARVLGAEGPEAVLSGGRGLLALSPWAGWLAFRRRRAPRTEFDRLWLAFRDRFGFVWGQRIREQFNRAAVHAGHPAVLHWRGLATTADSAALLAMLRAVLKRFGPEEERPPPREGSAA